LPNEPSTQVDDPPHPTCDASDHHHGSHARLVDRPDVAVDATAEVEAIIVPTARPVEHLRHALVAARELGCQLIAMCSKRSNASTVARLAHTFDVHAVALDIHRWTKAPWPTFGTSRLLAGTRFQYLPNDPNVDTSLKRNLGLFIARMAGWDRVVFLDDDISEVQPDQMRRAARLLDRYSAVGLGNTGYPDNSVVCHAFRITGGAQDTFIGAGALAVATSKTNAFFPAVYNEDWLFLADAVQRREVAAMGEVAQDTYDPFASPRRARMEEFGDCLAEGLFWLLDQGRTCEDATESFWVDYFRRRREFVSTLLYNVHRARLEPLLRDRVIESIKASQASQSLITPRHFVNYVAAWRADLTHWRDYLHEQAERTASLHKALAQLGLDYYASDPSENVFPSATPPTHIVEAAPDARSIAPRRAIGTWLLRRCRSLPQPISGAHLRTIAFVFGASESLVLSISMVIANLIALRI
jgi:hypothetical protein